MDPAPPLMGLLLAGGMSRRMGTDKAALRFAGTTLIERSWALLQPFVVDARVSVRADQATDSLRSLFPLLPDAAGCRGPAAGLLSAHEVFPQAAWLVIACDMPLLDSAHLEALVAGRDPQRDATVWQAAGAAFPEPLCAIYEPATLAAFRAHVAAGGKPSPSDWLAARSTKQLDPAGSGRDSEWLRSANTPEEFAAMVRQAPEER